MSIYLEIPWEDSKYLTIKYKGALRARGGSIFMYSGATLPSDLKPYRATDFSYARWLEDDARGREAPITKAPVQFKPQAHQKEAAKAILSSHKRGRAGFLLADKMGLGKGLLGSTKIPTPEGFKSMEEIAVGDIVYSDGGEPTKVLEKNLSTAKRFYKITFSDGATVYADEDHRWLTSTRLERARKSRPNTEAERRISPEHLESLRALLLQCQEERIGVTYSVCMEIIERENGAFLRELLSLGASLGKAGKEKVYHPQEVMENLSKIPLTKDNRWGSNYSSSAVRDTKEILTTLEVGSGFMKNHSVLNTAPLAIEERDLPVDPYILGVWLGDGGAHHCTITTMDEEIVECISKQYPLLSATHREDNKAATYRFSGLNSAIRDLYNPTDRGSKLDKFIPTEYLFSSRGQRLELLRGLMDTDGSITTTENDPHGGVSFAQRDGRLFHEVYALVCSLGWKATTRERMLSFKEGGEKRLYRELLFYPDANVFKLSRKREILEQRIPGFKENGKNKLRYITSVEKTEKLGEYYCISVDAESHMYLCTESLIPTHNTLSGLLSVAAIAQAQGSNAQNKATLLVVCPKSVIPVWRQTIQSYHVSTNFLRIMVINYQQLNKLLQAPKATGKAKKARTKHRATAQKGAPAIDFDYIIFDESHSLKNYPSSATSLAAASIAKLNERYIKGKSPFVIYSTATPGSTPLNFAIMANIMAPLISATDEAKRVTPATWGAFLAKQGFSVSKGAKGYNWISMPWYGKNASTPEEKAKQAAAERAVKVKQRKDTKRIGAALKAPGAPFIMRSPTDIAGWPEQQFIPLPLDLSTTQRATYEQVWSSFRKWLRLTPAKSDPKGALVQQLRYRQKVSLLKVESLIASVEEFVQAGNQVYISLEFIETLDEYKRALTAKKISVAELSGRNVKEREMERMRFQRGEAQVALCTVTAGISLHAGEGLPDGSKATTAPRITLMHDLRQNPLDTEQASGRAHRNGENSITYMPVVADTVDERVVHSFINKMSNLKAMTGASDGEIDYLEKLFRESA